MFFKQLSRFSLLVLLSYIFLEKDAYGQWAGTYGNEWINYGQTYLRIGVDKEGIQKVLLSSLPSDFPKNDPSKFQLWHRGKEVSIITANDTEIQFYGVPNDGASDSLVYRPASARLNANTSLFSDQGYYFLTISDNAKRVKTVDGSSLSGEAVTFHYKSEVLKFTNQFAGTTFGDVNAMNNSFYDLGNFWTGPTIAGKYDTNPSVTTTEFSSAFQLKKWVNNGIKPKLELLVGGLSEGFHDVQVYAGKSLSEGDLRKVTGFPFAGIEGRKATVDLGSQDFTADGLGNLKLLSVSTSTLDWFSLSYYKVTYPQLLDMQGETLGIFDFLPESVNQSRLKFTNVSVDASVYDISDYDNPTKIQGLRSGTTIDLISKRISGQSLKLAIASASNSVTIESKNINKVNFLPVYAFPAFNLSQQASRPASYDYLIVSNNNLKDASIQYAQYRSSTSGGSNRTLVMNIRDIYDQFNYGEPSPIAIRRYVNYMLKEGIRQDKHNLLLIGHSVSFPMRLLKEMPDEVPTFGDPGADMLLVAGLKNHGQDVPAIPVGRINAFTPADVLSYLSKVNEYEHNVELSWRKNILHLNGGHSASEINELKTILSDLSPVVESGELGGKVQAYVKTSPNEVEKADIAPEVNKGVGMITYFGHGSQTITDLDMGYVTDASRGYNNTGKYPLMYFNGCGVGNIFSSRITQILSGNWLLTKDKGAIAIISNSYKSYVSSSAQHLEVLYNSMFKNTSNFTVGQVLKDVAQKVSIGNPGVYAIANIHQSNLLGDPALRVIRVDKPDYAIDSDESITIYSDNGNVLIDNSTALKIGLVVTNGGRYINTENIDILTNFIYKDGFKLMKETSFPSVAYQDTLFLSIPNRKNLLRVEVTLDPANKIQELSKNNNYSELTVDWDVAKLQSFYPTERTKDIIPPILSVKFNNRSLKNEDIISPNPLIKLTLEDNHVLDIDTTLIDIYIKECKDNSCDFKRISYSDNKLELTMSSNRMLQVLYRSGLAKEGSYELMVNSRDKLKNVTASQYRISFSIKENEDQISVVNSPNPATNYVHFELKSYDADALDKIVWKVYDLKGTLHEERTILASELINNDWYWLPKVPAGLYVYKVIFTKNDIQTNTLTGKIVLLK